MIIKNLKEVQKEKEHWEILHIPFLLNLIPKKELIEILWMKLTKKEISIILANFNQKLGKKELVVPKIYLSKKAFYLKNMIL